MDKTPTLLLDREQFQAWKEHPVTAEFFQYLRDRQSRLKDRWAEGTAWTPEEQAQAVQLGRLLGISSDEIAADYAIEENINGQG
jgi:hypothetical protein